MRLMSQQLLTLIVHQWLLWIWQRFPQQSSERFGDGVQLVISTTASAIWHVNFCVSLLCLGQQLAVQMSLNHVALLCKANSWTG